MLIDKKYLMKFDRICAWLLIAIMATFFISGYGMTKGIISPQLAKLLHETILPIPTTIAFAFHSAYGMHIAFKRWKWWGRIPMTLLIVYASVLIIGVLFFEFAVKLPGGSVSVPQKLDL